MSKKIIIGISATVVAIAGVVAYRYFVPPKFMVTRYSPSDKKGEFEFGGVRNAFGNSVGTFGSRGGWNLNTSIDKNGITIFRLFKKDKYVKDLKNNYL
jgi:hypothetical protein